MGSADYLRLDDWNIRCDRCGRKIKGSQAMTTWQGFKVCPEHWEPRQAQDFVRTVVEHPTPPFIRDPLDYRIGSDAIILEAALPITAETPNYILAEDSFGYTGFLLTEVTKE